MVGWMVGGGEGEGRGLQHVLVEGHEPVPKVLGPHPSGEQYWPAVFVQVYVGGGGGKVAGGGGIVGMNLALLAVQGGPSHKVVISHSIDLRVRHMRPSRHSPVVSR